MADPFYRVHVAGVEITRYVTSFEYEDCTDKDDLVTIGIGGYPLELLENPAFVEGAELTALWGIVGGGSHSVSAVLRDIEPEFAAFNTGTLKALDKGHGMKKSEKNTVWKKVKTSDIARQIAKAHGLTFSGPDTPKEWPEMMQGNRTDYEFLEYLYAKEFGGAAWHVFVKGDKLIAKKRDLGAAPKVKFTLGDPSSGIVSFTPKHKGTDIDGAAGETTAQGFDMMEKKPVVSKVNTDASTSLGGTGYSYNADAAAVTGKFVKAPKKGWAFEEYDKLTTGKSLPVPTGDQTEADNTASTARKDAQMKNLTADLVRDGDITAKADTIITVAGVPKRYQGNWYAKTVKHSISGASYLTTYELTKDGADAPTSVAGGKNNDANTGTGADNNKDTKEILKYDADGKLQTGEFVKPRKSGFPFNQFEQ